MNLPKPNLFSKFFARTQHQSNLLTTHNVQVDTKLLKTDHFSCVTASNAIIIFFSLSCHR